MAILSDAQVIELLRNHGVELSEEHRALLSARYIHGVPVTGVAATARGFYEGSGRKHVLMVSGPCCIRVMKESAALRARGWRVDSLSLVAPTVEDAFDYSVIAGSATEFPDLVAAIRRSAHPRPQRAGLASRLRPDRQQGPPGPSTTAHTSNTTTTAT
jgi:hypothetical protein